MDGDNNVIRVMLPDHYSGIVAVTYEIPPYYRAADLCSLTALVAIAAICFFMHNPMQGKHAAKAAHGARGE